MARPRKNPLPTPTFQPAAPQNAIASWAEQLGEALGRGVARGINAGLSGASFGGFSGGGSTLGPVIAPRRRGRPPKALTGGPVPADRQCKVAGCGRPARSKGLCSAHYQAERRRLMQSKSA